MRRKSLQILVRDMCMFAVFVLMDFGSYGKGPCTIQLGMRRGKKEVTDRKKERHKERLDHRQ